MRISRRLVRFVGLVLCGAFVLSCGRTGPLEPERGGAPIRNCCMMATTFGPMTIAANAAQVPIELQGCGANREEITAITIGGTLSGCAGNSSDVTFSNLTIDFTTDRTRCGGQGTRTSRVGLTDVHYTGELQLSVAPSCVSQSSVAPRFGINPPISDPGFATLFATNGPETLRPILNHLALRWASSPTGACPPSAGFGTAPGTTTSCPH